MAPTAESPLDAHPVRPAGSDGDRHTPTPAGYLAAGALTVGLFGVVVGIASAATMAIDGDLGIAGAIAAAVTHGFAAGVGAAVAGAVVGLPLAMIAHIALKPVRSPAVHAAGFGVVGGLTAVALLALFGFLAWQPVAWFLIGAAGSCAALSRYLIGRRQRRRPGTSSATGCSVGRTPP